MKQALAESEAGRWHEAGLAAARAWHAASDQPRAADVLLKFGAHLAQQSETPALATAVSETIPAQGLISFVVCSITPHKLARLQRDASRCFSDGNYEFIHIGDARSLCEGNMRGMRQARGEILIFCHDDIGIVNDDFEQRLRAQLASHDLVGVAGTQQLVGPAWHWGGALTSASRVAMPSESPNLTAVLFGTDVGAMPEAQALDGVFVAGKRHVFEAVPYDAETFDGFHLYDIDQSYRAYLAGFRCAVALDLIVWHESIGRFSEAWRKYAIRFVEKFPAATPRAKGAPYDAGTHVLNPRLIPGMYAWVDYWLTHTVADVRATQ